MIVYLFGMRGWLLIVLFVFLVFVLCSLYDYVFVVVWVFCSEDFEVLCVVVGMIVGCDMKVFDEFGIVCVVIESLVESFCDGVVVLLFWLLVFGLFGVWIYKVINIVDSLIGYCEECWCVFGWVVVCSDDLFNLIFV